MYDIDNYISFEPLFIQYKLGGWIEFSTPKTSLLYLLIAKICFCFVEK